MEVAMYGKPSPTPLERGQFSDGRRVFVVRASSPDAPDSFVVHTKGNQSDVILLVSGLNSGDLHATWSDEWRSATSEWREWARNNAFKAFHTVTPAEPATPAKIRFCRG
jgi:hypothetical protein